MPELDSLASPEGRNIYRSLYTTLRQQRQLGALETLRILWRIAVGERSLRNWGHDNITFRHKLGIVVGTRLWLEEIVSRYYYSTVVSFVYAGAAILLVVVGLRRFSGGISDTIVMLSIGLEALLLLLLFTVMFVSPAEDIRDPVVAQLDDIVREIGEIGREHAASTMALEKAASAMERLIGEAKRLADAAESAARAAATATSPAPETIVQLEAVNRALAELRTSIESLAIAARRIEHEAIESAVRAEVERLLAARVHDRTSSAQR
jgi:hypothetical protein